MVRGLCPRDRIRGAVDARRVRRRKRGQIGHAERVRLTKSGNPANAGRRGRRPLRAGAYVGISIVENGCANAVNFCPPLGSPERGAGTARSGVTEGLVQRWSGRTSVARRPAPGGRGSPPLWRVGSGCTEYNASVNRRRRTGDGAPYEAKRNVQQQTHAVRQPTEGASGTPPPTAVARCRYQRSREA